jgi:hypothetical protein
MTTIAPSPATLAARRFFRLAPALLRLLREVRANDMDSGATRRLAIQVPLLARAVERSVPAELNEELRALTPALSEDDASEDEVRVALAALVGWVEGAMDALALTEGGGRRR